MAERSYAAVAIGGDGPPSTSPTFALVVALLTLGARPLPVCPVIETVEEIGGAVRHDHVWMFGDRADAGFETDKLRKWWSDPAWLEANPTHPLALLRRREAFDGIPSEILDRSRRIEAWLREELKKSVPLAVVRKGQKRVLIPIDATPAEEALWLEKLNDK